MAFELRRQFLVDLALPPRPELARRDVLRTTSQALRDVIAAHHQVRPAIISPAHDDVDVRVIRIVVGNRHPIELRAQVGLPPAASAREW